MKKQFVINFSAKYIAVDLGTKSLGIATSNGIIITPRTTFFFKAHDFKSCSWYLIKFCQKIKADTLVIGVAKHNHRISKQEQAAKKLAHLVKKNLTIKIIFWDESFSSFQAQEILNQKKYNWIKTKNKIDQIAAVQILQSYFNNFKK